MSYMPAKTDSTAVSSRKIKKPTGEVADFVSRLGAADHSAALFEKILKISEKGVAFSDEICYTVTRVGDLAQLARALR